MATNRNAVRNADESEQPRRRRAKWFVAGVGFVWFFIRTLRRKRKGHARDAELAPAPTRVSIGLPQKGHEVRDAHPGWIFGVIIFLFIAGLCIHFLLAGALSWLKRTAPPTDRWPPSQQAAQRVASTNSYPHLQIAPAVDLEAFRVRENAELSNYGWINRTEGIVRIPIQRAMELVLEEGLPTRTGTNEKEAGLSEYQLIQQRQEYREREIQGAK